MTCCVRFTSDMMLERASLMGSVSAGYPGGGGAGGGTSSLDNLMDAVPFGDRPKVTTPQQSGLRVQSHSRHDSLVLNMVMTWTERVSPVSNHPYPRMHPQARHPRRHTAGADTLSPARHGRMLVYHDH